MIVGLLSLFFVGWFSCFLSFGWVISSSKPWLDKRSGSLVTTSVVLLVLEVLVGKILWNPLVGWVTSLGSLSWTNTLESRRQVWVELLVLEALVGTNNLKALEGLDWDQFDDGVVMFDHEVESLFYGFRRMASRSPGWVFYWCVLCDPTFMLGIWRGGDWLKRDMAQPIYGQVERGSPISSWFIAFINYKFIPLIFMCRSTDVYMDFHG